MGNPGGLVLQDSAAFLLGLVWFRIGQSVQRMNAKQRRLKSRRRTTMTITGVDYGNKTVTVGYYGEGPASKLYGIQVNHNNLWKGVIKNVYPLDADALAKGLTALGNH